MEKLIKFLDKNKISYFEDYDISSLSSIKMGNIVKLLIMPKSIKDLTLLLKFCHHKKYPFRVFGNLSNVLFVSKIDYPIILTSKMQTEIKFNNNIVTCSSGVLLSVLCEQLKKHSLSGLEPLSGIPATVGGAIFNNAGAFGKSISDNLVSVLVFFQGKILSLDKNDIKFGYHFASLFGFIVLQATFLFEFKNEYDIIKLYNEFSFKRNESQPVGFSLGSVYKKANDFSAGLYIERSGLKGTRVGGVMVSKKHANFFINDGTGSVYDFISLSKIVETKVMNDFGITLCTEIEKVG